MACAKKAGELKLVTIGYDEGIDNDGFKECGLHYSKCCITGTLNMKRKTGDKRTLLIIAFGV